MKDNDRGKLTYSEKNQSQCQFVHHISHRRSEIEPEPPRGDRPATNYLHHDAVRPFGCFKAENAFWAIAVWYSNKCSGICNCLHAEELLSWKIKVIYFSYMSVNNYQTNTLS
jgi:hypothetical protein